jgi:aminopeptidase
MAAVTASPPSGGLLEPEQLARYADAAVHACVRLQPGDSLFVQGHPAHRELIVALAEAAYRAGAGLVDVHYTDPRMQAARVRHAADDHLGPVTPWSRRRLRAHLDRSSASVAIIGEADPGVFDGLPPARVAEDSMRPLRRLGWYVRAIEAGRTRWVAVGWPTEFWAGQVYPELDSREAQSRLMRDLLWFCRLGPDDPPGAEGWSRHVAAIADRALALTKLRLERVELRGPGTELAVRLSPGTRWLGGEEENALGQLLAANMPTEENFTSPDARGADGSFCCTRPLSFHGRLIEGIAGEFRGGRLVRLSAASDDDRDFLAAFLDSDRNARRLGEVALVDSSSRIGQADRTYFNTLIDENAVAHIAFGMGFGQTRAPDPSARGARGVNKAKLHLDVMIGGDDFEATGVADGRRVPLIRDGSWQI